MIKTKIKITNCKLYGGNSPSCSSNVLLKIRNKNLKLYGHPRGPNSNSCLQEQILEFIKHSYEKEIISNFPLYNKDIDIYIPELKLGFEVNGDYWHSVNKGIDKFKHLEKLELAESKGIRLLYIWEHEWKNNQDYMKYIIQSYLKGKIPDISSYNGKLPRDYFSTLDFSSYKIEEPVLEKSGKFDVYKTGFILI